jgi:hypothetical protein
MNVWSGLFAVIGAIGLVVGLLGAVGSIPGLAVAPCPYNGGTISCGPHPSIVVGLTVAPAATSANITITGTFSAGHGVTGSSQAPGVGTLAAPALTLKIDGATVPLKAQTTYGPLGVAFKNGPNYYALSVGNHTAQATATTTYSGTNYTATSPVLSFSVGTTVVKNTTQVSIAPSFSWTLSGATLTAVDTSTVSGTSAAPTIAWSFGDGGSGSGRYVNHTYTTQGKYTVTDTVTVGSAPSATTASAARAVAVFTSGGGGGSGGSGGCGAAGQPACSSTGNVTATGSVAINAVTALLIFGFGGMLVLAVVPGNPGLKGALGLILFVGGFVGGYLVGGPGPL